MNGKRGVLTDEIKLKSVELLGYEINTVELRLIPYLQYVMVNEHQIDPRKINHEERVALSKWKKVGYIGSSFNPETGMIDVAITYDFWVKICELIFLAYVGLEEE